MPTELLKGPWIFQVILASGYAAYALAYVGIRSHHSAIDVGFGTLVFSLVTTAAISLSKSLWDLSDTQSAVVAFIGSVLVGAFWRVVGRRILRFLLRITDISLADEAPSAWKAMFDISGRDLSQVAVKLKDGTWLRCDDASQFRDADFGPCVLGSAGDILLYLTHTVAADGVEKALSSTRDVTFGDRVTYVPASEIQQVNLRWVERR